MKPISGRTLSLMLSLSVMLLMTVALIAGQADASLHDAAHAGAGASQEVKLAGPNANDAAVIAVDIPDLSVAVPVDPELGRKVATFASDAFREFMNIE